ncbi:MAG: alpha-mannosidase, partial [Cyanobacteriota bacterium]
AWLWPVADTWQAAERTFRSVLQLMEHQEQLHFGHSTPALYAWLERHRPALHARIRTVMRQGRWEPLNGPWVECDCVLLATASLLRQFQEGQWYSRSAFPEWSHALAWLPDSFGFSAGLPPVAAATGVRWFCTHKLAWTGENPFPHRLFRWRGRCGREVLALMTAAIGTDGDPVAMERWRLGWERDSGVAEALWLPGVGDHGGGPTLEMLEQLALWQGREGTVPQTHGTLRDHLARLEPLAPHLPVWRDELYLELHRGCPTSRPDQKRHNRSLERLLREAETARALLAAGEDAGGEAGAAGLAAPNWRPLLFQQFHDILPGTSIPEVFEQAEPIWRRARRDSRGLRDQALRRLLDNPEAPGPELDGRQRDSGRRAGAGNDGTAWTAVQLSCLPATPRTVRLPKGPWWCQGLPLAAQGAPEGGEWVQLPGLDGVAALPLTRWRGAPAAGAPPVPPHHPVTLQRLPGEAERWRLANGLLAVTLGPLGVEEMEDATGHPLLAAPPRWCRYGDRGEFWDAWDLAPTYRDHPLPWIWDGEPQWLARGPLCGHVVWRGRCGQSPVRLDGRLLAGTPWFELVLRLDWRQRHELLRLQVPLASRACRWAADAPGGVSERPTVPHTPREQSRWEVSAVSWIASVAQGRGDGLAVLLDGPQGASATPEELGVSLLRAPTWPDPGADNGPQRLRLALMPATAGWRASAVAQHACRFREPLWLRPRPRPGSQPTMATLPSQEPDVQVVGLQAAPGGGGRSVLSVQNLGPCRRRLRLGVRGEVARQLAGLHDPLDPPDAGMDGGWPEGNRPEAVLAPWSLTFWEVRLGAPESG